MKFTVVFSSLLLSIVAQKDGQPWGVDSFDSGNSGNGPFSLSGLLGGINFFGGPSYLWNVTRQARQDYYKILQNKNLTRAQITTAVGNWSNTYNVVDQVTAYNTKKQTEKTTFRANVTAAVQQLPTLISQLNSIEDNQNLTPSAAAQQTRQTIHNATIPFLREHLESRMRLIVLSRTLFGR